jgi:hypothetical protein
MENVTGIIGGQSGVGKTFLSMDLAVAIASGQPFLGHETLLPGGVVIIAAEGGGDFNNRLMAIKRERGIKERLPVIHTLKCGDKPGGLRNLENVAERIAAIRSADAWFKAKFSVPLRAVIIDTVNAAWPLGESQENNTYASEVTGVMELIRAQLGVTTLAIHHFGKNQADGYRGGSAFKGNLDQAFALVYLDGEGKIAGDKGIFGDNATTEFVVDKNRYGAAGFGFGYELAKVSIGISPHGFPITSRVIRGVQRTEEAEGPGKEGKLFDRAMSMATKQSSFEHVSLDGEIVRAVLANAVRGLFYGLYKPSADEPGLDDEMIKKRREACRRAYNRAVADFRSAGGKSEFASGKECLFK